MTDASNHGCTTVELLFGTAIGLAVVATLTIATAIGGRLLLRTTSRGELHDIADITADAFRFDLRRAGFTTAAALSDPLAVARTDQITVHADLNGDGSIDPNSEETVSIACLSSPTRVSRIVGAQSLPLANDVVTCGLRYFDAGGAEIVPPPGGLDVSTRGHVVAVELFFILTTPGLPAQTGRRVLLSRRDVP